MRTVERNKILLFLKWLKDEFNIDIEEETGINCVSLIRKYEQGKSVAYEDVRDKLLGEGE